MLSLDVFLMFHFLQHSNVASWWVPGTQMLTVYDFVLAVAMLRMFGSDSECSGLAGVYTFKSSDRYFGYAVVNAVWHKEPIF